MKARMLAQQGLVPLDVIVSCCKEVRELKESSPPPPPPPPPPPIKAIFGFALGATLVGNLGGIEGILNETFPKPQPKPPNSEQPSPVPPRSPYQDAFANNIKARLGDCIEKYIIELSGIPTLSTLLESLSFERDADSEFEYQLMVLYTRVQQLRTAIDSCDPALAGEILEARKRFFADEKVVVIKDFTYVFVEEDSGRSYTEFRVEFGTFLEIDHEMMATLSQEQRNSLISLEGWLPIILENRGRGFINSEDVRKVIRPTQVY